METGGGEGIVILKDVCGYDYREESLEKKGQK